MINFEDTQTAYALKNDDELKLAQYMFKMLQSKVLSDTGRSLLKFSVAARLPVNGLIKKTLYRHFVGGDSIPSTIPLMKRLGAHKVASILDYSLEGIQDERMFDRAVGEFLANVEEASQHQEVPFSVFKPSAIARGRLLEKLSAKVDLTPIEQEEYERVHRRFQMLFERAFQLKVRVLVDAEDSWTQAAIDDLTNEMIRTYNRDEIIAVNTFQMYRHDRLDYLRHCFEWAREDGVKMGVKLVRGAYMEKERERADKMGYPSPIYATKEDTDKAFDDAVQLCLDNLDHCELFIGTHNEYSIQKAVDYMERRKIEKDDPRVWFSQLYGMCDYLTFNLAEDGYNVAKYIPYGPVKAVVPYLMRRADENSSVAGQARKELRLIESELLRRKS